MAGLGGLVGEHLAYLVYPRHRLLLLDHSLFLDLIIIIINILLFLSQFYEFLLRLIWYFRTVLLLLSMDMILDLCDFVESLFFVDVVVLLNLILDFIQQYQIVDLVSDFVQHSELTFQQIRTDPESYPCLTTKVQF
jgi:hypothetical protein